MTLEQGNGGSEFDSWPMHLQKARNERMSELQDWIEAGRPKNLSNELAERVLNDPEALQAYLDEDQRLTKLASD